MIGLISCSAKKLARAAPARELYVSALFKKSLAYAEQHCEIVYVLSAKHGLVELDTVLEPYDTKLAESFLPAGACNRKPVRWAKPVVAELVRRHGDELYVILAGQDYGGPIREGLKRALGAHAFVAEPLAGMGIGDRLGYLTAQTRRAA